MTPENTKQQKLTAAMEVAPLPGGTVATPGGGINARHSIVDVPSYFPPPVQFGTDFFPDLIPPGMRHAKPLEEYEMVVPQIERQRKESFSRKYLHTPRSSFEKNNGDLVPQGTFYRILFSSFLTQTLLHLENR